VGIMNKMFGFRWSLYIVRDENKIAYAMHENSVIRILGYVMSYFEGGAQPVHPWSIYLNFNHTHKTIKLCAKHFTEDGENLTSQLINEIAVIDPGYRVKDGEPIFEEAATKKRLKISEYEPGKIDISAMLNNINKPREVTFFSVMDTVFGK